MTEFQQGIYSDISNADYHGAAGISKSGLDLVSRCPALYKRRYIDGIIDGSTKAMDEGSLIHHLVLEPEKPLDEFAVEPDVDKRTKVGKAAMAEFALESVGKTTVTSAQFRQCQAIANAVLDHDVARNLLTGGIAETSVFHRDLITGEIVKVRADYLKDESLVVDLKTTFDASESGFSKSCGNFRYHVQAALYLDVINAKIGGYKSFVFVVVEKSEPHNVAIYVASNDMLETGRKQYINDIQAYADFKSANYWPGYNDDRITIIDLPAWARR